MEKLDIQAPADQPTITMTRIIKAPREKVFDAYVNPELIAKWWGGRTYSTSIETFEGKSGGSWRFVQKDKQGGNEEYKFHGVFHEVAAPHRIIQTFEFDGLPETGHVLLGTTTFEAVDGGTKITDQSVFQSVADRDGMLESGMAEGSSEGFDVLAELVEGEG